MSDEKKIEIAFFSRSSYPVGESNPTGAKTEPEFSVKIDKNGKADLVETGKKPTYEKIQASLQGNTVRDILDRFTKGDNMALGVDTNSYADITNAPTTLAAAQQQMIDAEKFFMSLPVDIRRQYDHNITTFLNSVNSGEFIKNHGLKTGLIKVFEDPDKKLVEAAKPVIQNISEAGIK